MKRRHFIVKTAKGLGYTVTAGALTQLVSACQKDTPAAETAQKTVAAPPANAAQTYTHSAADIETLSTIADIIIPKTDTPSASEVGAITFMTTFVKEVFNEKQKDAFFNGLAALRATVLKANNKDFLELDSDKQTALISQLDSETFAKADTTSAEQAFYKHAKKLTVLGYYQSETVGEKILNYDPIPGGFIGCMPYDGKVMSLN